MTYKKYIKKGEKFYGPYVYRSKRQGDRVLTEYIGEAKSSSKKDWFLIIVLCFLVISIIFLSLSLSGSFGIIKDNAFEKTVNYFSNFIIENFLFTMTGKASQDPCGDIANLFKTYPPPEIPGPTCGDSGYNEILDLDGSRRFNQ